MKISILTPDVSSNGLGRAYILAKMLQRNHEVEIVGPMFGSSIWEPVANDSTISYKFIKISKFTPYLYILGLLNKIDGQVIYASKPVFSSFGIALFKKIISGKKVILDIDDWEFGFKKDAAKNKSVIKRILFWGYSTLLFHRHGSYWNVLLHEKLIHLADAKTVSNVFLKDKFGGEIIHHARDTDAFDPEKFNKSYTRGKYNIGLNKKVVMFFGSPKPHKGLDELLAAVQLIDDDDVVLVVVGMNYDNKYCKFFANKAKDTLKHRFITFGFTPFELIPEFLSLADVMVIPQQEGNFSQGQMPAKVFDAMAMAKPVIATNVGSLASILEHCGIVVPPGNIIELKDAIKRVVYNTESMREMGKKAREKCIKYYSLDAVGAKLNDIFLPYG